MIIEKIDNACCMLQSEFLHPNHTSETRISSVPFGSGVRSGTSHQGQANFAIGTLGMDWLIREAVTLAGPLYAFLQLIMVVRYRGRWLALALLPLFLVLPLAAHAGLTFTEGHPVWPMLLLLAAPIACVYLLCLALIKASVSRP